MRLAARAIVLLLLACFGVTQHRPSQPQTAGLHLRVIRSIDLHKSNGQVDQVIELPDGNLLVRDSTLQPLEAQIVELYDRSGNLIRKIGSFGQEPGHYFALQKLAFSPRSNLIWVVDRFGRISRFDLSGKFIDSILLQKPGYHPYDLVLDEDHNRYFLTGCVPLHFYLNRGCQIIHEYELNTNKYLRSFLETDPEAVTKQYFGLEDYQISLGSSGLLYAIDAPVRKLWRISAQRTIEAFPVQSKAVGTIPPLDPAKDNSVIGEHNFMLDRIFSGAQDVIVAAHRKTPDASMLEVFSVDGKSIALDVTAPGQLIGRSPRGTLWFGQRSSKGFVISEYSLQRL